MLTSRSLCAPFLALALMGCAAQAQTENNSPTAHAEGDPQTACIAPGQWFDPKTDQNLATPAAIARLSASDIVLLGETHVVPDHHRWHNQTVAQLYARRPDMILGFEAFPRRVQPALDDWVAGKLTEEEFLKRSEWNNVWRYDPELYMPLFHFARLNRVPMVALNVDRALLGRVSALGWDGVPKNERRGVGDPAAAPEGYIQMLGRIYGQHGNGQGGTNGAPKAPGLEDKDFANFVDVQVTWDRAMAEAVQGALATARAEGRDPQMVAVIGRGHLDFDFGVPHQLADLGLDDVQVAVPWDKLRKCAELKSELPPADLAFGLQTTRDYMPQDSNKPLLGVLIEAADAGVRINQVVDGSVAEAAGLKSGDVITHAAGRALSETGDLITIVQAMPPGTLLPLTVQRDDATLHIDARFPVDGEAGEPVDTQ